MKTIPVADTLSIENYQVGQKVVLMDANLRGTLVSLGRRAVIELEDGLTIEAAYGEFVITQAEELSSLEHTAVSRRAHKPASKKSSTAAHSQLPEKQTGPKQISVDLHIEKIPGGKQIPHGHQLQFQMETFRSVLRRHISHRGLRIACIHGVGDGILKAAIRKELDEVYALRCTYTLGDPAVTYITIR